MKYWLLFLCMIGYTGSLYAQADWSATVLAQRAKTDSTIRDPYDSALGYALATDFPGFDYFPMDAVFHVAAVFEAFGVDSTMTLLTSTGDMQAYERTGTLTFDLGGQTHTLTLFAYGPGALSDDPASRYFLPFKDLTNGNESYGGGRYMHTDTFPEPLHNGDTVHVAFNSSYAPSCAYSPLFSCPLVPRENWLSVPVRAGVKHQALPEVTYPAAAAWHVVPLPESGYQVMFPAPPQSEVVTEEVQIGEITTRIHELHYEPQTHHLMVEMVLPPTFFDMIDPVDFLDYLVADQLKNAEEVLLESSETTQDSLGIVHKQVVSDGAAGYMQTISHWFMAAPGIYQLSLVVPRDQLDAYRTDPFFRGFTRAVIGDISTTAQKGQ